MNILYFEALAAIALSLSILTAGAWIVQQRTGNSGWVDTIRTFAVGAGSALWPVADAASNTRQWLVAAPVAIRSVRLGLHIAARAAGISDDPRYAAFGEALADAQLGHFRIDPPGIFSVRPCSITPRERYP